jgi:hypothetical protein
MTSLNCHIAFDIGSRVPWFVRWKSTRRNSAPRVGYRGVIKSRTNNKFGEFTLPLRTSKINITQAIDRLFIWWQIMHDRPTQITQSISNKPPLHAFRSVITKIIERVPHATCVFQLWTNQRRVKRLQSVRISKLQRKSSDKS